MKTFFLLPVFLFLLQPVIAQVNQEWIAIYNGGPGQVRGRAVAPDNLGNVVVAGRSQLFQDARLHTVKYDATGQVVWTKEYSKPETFPDVQDLKADASGNIYLLVNQTAVTIFNSGTLLIKYLPNGDTAWTRLIPSLSQNQHSIRPVELEIDAQGNVILLCSDFGQIGGTSTSTDFVIFKYNGNGELLLSRFIDNNFTDDHPQSIDVDGSGNVVVTGHSLNPDNSIDAFTVKVNAAGTVQWSKVVPGGAAKSAGFDNSGNIIIGGSRNDDILIIKYNSLGNVVWERTFNGTANDIDNVWQLAVDNAGSVYVLGQTLVTGSNGDLITLKYNAAGIRQWIKTYGGNRNFTEFPVGIRVDQAGNSYIGCRVFENENFQSFLTISYSPSGDSLWAKLYNASPENDELMDIELDNNRNVYVTGTGYATVGLNQITDIRTIKYSQSPMPEVLKPTPYSKLIAGEKDSINWTDPGWAAVNIICKTNVGTPLESELVIAQGMPNPSSKFLWSIPDTLLSYRSRIIIENANNTTEKIESDIFRIKPYLITNLNSDSTYRAYKINRDNFFAPNDSAFQWPFSFYNQFRYRSGIDPFTNMPYSPLQADSVFSKAFINIHPDWVSWVKTFSTDACYFSVQNGWYKPSAVLRWDASNGLWNGSCFGLAGASAMLFENQTRFEARYPNYPSGFLPISVTFNNSVREVINEIFTYQFGSPSVPERNNHYKNTTPIMLLNQVKEMLIADTVEFRTLSFWNNSGSGGHNLLVYGLKKDAVIDGVYYLQVYDSNFPMGNTPIQISTLAGNGFWASTDYPGWGGNKRIILETPSDAYYTQTTFANRNGNQSPFAVAENELQVFTKSGSGVKISDGQGNLTGYVNGQALETIPGSIPLISLNGRETPPYGYSLPASQYSVRFNSFVTDTVQASFFTGNKTFIYERGGATGSQTDHLHFDGGISVANPDAQTKTVKLLNLVAEASQEKMTVIRSLNLAQSDSVKVSNTDSNTVRLISFGTAKEYDIEFNFAGGTGIDRFVANDIPLTPNTTHTISPSWSNLGSSQLNILIDEGNNGTIDDTVKVVNQVTGIKNQGSLSTPKEYELAQNYPNPFNPATKIRYAIPQAGTVKLHIYDVLGNKVAELVNGEKPAGVYEVDFNAAHLASGIYYYRIHAGSFVQVKKMIVMK